MSARARSPARSFGSVQPSRYNPAMSTSCLRFRLISLILLTLPTMASGIAAASAMASVPDHYLCYRAVLAKRQAKFPKGISTTLDDAEGGPRPFEVKKITAICNPVDRDGSGTATPPVHLEAFAIKAPKSAPKFLRTERVRTDFFGQHTLTVTGLATLLDVTPLALGASPPPAFASDPTADPTVNRFKCYKAKLAKGPKFIPPAPPVLTDEIFAGGHAFVVRKVVKLCEAVDKDGKTPGAEDRQRSLVCYAVKPAKGPVRFTKTTVAVHDADFSPHVLVATAPVELCMPALAPTATPTLTPTPTATPSPAADKHVFVTSTTTTGGFGGVFGADAICAARATAAGLVGTFRAWMSVSGDGPNTRFAQSTGPYTLVDGTVIADDWSDLVDGSIGHAIDVDEHGTTVGASEVWTATTGTGAPTALNCNDFSGATGAVFGVCGSTVTTSSAWTNAGTPSCNAALRLYCFEQ